jgi:hypothetical protein
VSFLVASSFNKKRHRFDAKLFVTSLFLLSKLSKLPVLLLYLILSDLRLAGKYVGCTCAACLETSPILAGVDLQVIPEEPKIIIIYEDVQNEAVLVIQLGVRPAAAAATASMCCRKSSCQRRLASFI